MRPIILAVFAIPLAFAANCGELKTCYECDSAIDTNGDQQCSWCVSTESCVPKSGLECTFGTKIPDKTDCPVPIRPGFEYNDTLSRKMMFVAGAAYGDNPDVCLNRQAPDIKVYKQVTLSCDGTGDTCSAFIGISDVEKAIVIGFRGTYGDVQLLIEAVEVIFKDKSPMEGGGVVGKYFYTSFYSVWNNGISDNYKKLRALYPTYDLWLTGHSMGAALAAVAASAIAYEKIIPAEQIKVITFGEPRVGDRDFAVEHDNLLLHSYRVTHRHDLVPHLPPKDLLLGYHHHRYEVWYDNDMNKGDPFVVCLSPEDKSCSDKNLINTSGNDHRFYFGIDVQDLIDHGCRESA